MVSHESEPHMAPKDAHMHPMLLKKILQKKIAGGTFLGVCPYFQMELGGPVQEDRN